jgi:hypothetical protein
MGSTGNKAGWTKISNWLVAQSRKDHRLQLAPRTDAWTDPSALHTAGRLHLAAWGEVEGHS